MNGLCLRCGQREREPGLLMCRDCLERLFGKPANDRPRSLPEWRRRLTARDETGRVA